jgi:transposase
MGWHFIPKRTVDPLEIERRTRRPASFISATNQLDEPSLSQEEVFLTSKAQGRVERGCRLLNDPLFLASSALVQKTEQVIALRFIMVLCVLISR